MNSTDAGKRCHCAGAFDNVPLSHIMHVGHSSDEVGTLSTALGGDQSVVRNSHNAHEVINLGISQDEMDDP
jgi:hypothetical protein